MGVVATKKLLEVNKVELVGGFWGSPIALAAKPLILAHDALLEPTAVAYWLILAVFALVFLFATWGVLVRSTRGATR